MKGTRESRVQRQGLKTDRQWAHLDQACFCRTPHGMLGPPLLLLGECFAGAACRGLKQVTSLGSWTAITAAQQGASGKLVRGQQCRAVFQCDLAWPQTTNSLFGPSHEAQDECEELGLVDVQLDQAQVLSAALFGHRPPSSFCFDDRVFGAVFQFIKKKGAKVCHCGERCAENFVPQRASVGFCATQP